MRRTSNILPNLRAIQCVLGVIGAVLSLLITGCTTVDSPPSPAKTQTLEEKPALIIVPGVGVDESYTQDRVYFDNASAKLTPNALVVIQRTAEWFKKYPQVSMRIEGHTDQRGSAAYNYALGLKRANAVRAALLSFGLPQNQITQTVSYGKKRPDLREYDNETRRQNRCVVMILQAPK